jgi:hypothetical protein
LFHVGGARRGITVAGVTEPIALPLCSWPVDRSCLPAVDAPIDIAKQTYAEELAIHTLWSLSGRQFGVCPVIMRPCQEFTPVLMNGISWRYVGCGCAGLCDWRAPSVVHLISAGFPIQAVTEVKIGAAVLDASQYTLEGDLLYRAGNAAWPSQNLALPLGQDGTWSVTYTRGNPVPAGVGVLVGLLTKEYISACSGGRCKLPRRVRSVSRQGVTMDMVDPTDIYATGKTGLPEIDLWLSAVNPHRLTAPSKVR